MDITTIASILSIFLIPCLIGTIITTNILSIKNRKLKEKISSLESEIERKSRTIKSINDEKSKEDFTGRTGVYVEPSLTFGNEKDKSFSVTYDVEILESTTTKFKIKALSFTVNQSHAKDPKYKSDLMSYIENKWVDRSKVQLVMDLATKRAIKLEKLGI